MSREPLYPHVPGEKEVQFPHVPKSRQLAGKVTRLPQTEKGKYAWWMLDPETGEIMIKEGFATPEKAKISAKAYAIRRARWVAVLSKRVVELRIYDRPPDIGRSEIGIVFEGHILTPEGKIVEVPERPLPLAQDTIDYLASTEGDSLRKFCCRICGECAPKELLEEGRFPDRIAWLRHHYKEKHPGMWGKMAPMTVEDGEPVSPEYRHLANLVSEPLPKDAY